MGDILPGDLAWLFGVPLLVVAILVLVAARRDDDPGRVRTEARYLGVILLISLFVTLFAVFGVVRGLTDLMVDRRADQWFGYTPLTNLENVPVSCLPGWPLGDPDDCPEFIRDGDMIWPIAAGSSLPSRVHVNLRSAGSGQEVFAPILGDNDAYRLVLGSALLAGAAGGVFVFHRRRCRVLTAKRGFRAGAGGLVERAFVYGVCFVAAVVVIVGATRGLYGLFRVIVPGVTGEGAHGIERKLGIAQFLSYLVLVSGVVWIFRAAWRSPAREA